MSDKELFDALGKAILDNKVPEWRQEFICSVQTWWEKTGRITDKQRDALEDILEECEE